MNINKFLKLFLISILFFQFQTLKADDTNKIDDEELPAIDPFAGGVGNTSQGSIETSSQSSQGSGLLNNMRLVGTIMGKNKKIAIFIKMEAFKFEERMQLTTTTILDIFNEVVIVKMDLTMNLLYEQFN